MEYGLGNVIPSDQHVHSQEYADFGVGESQTAPATVQTQSSDPAATPPVVYEELPAPVEAVSRAVDLVNPNPRNPFLTLLPDAADSDPTVDPDALSEVSTSTM